MHTRYRGGFTIQEVELVFDSAWMLLGYQVTIQAGGKRDEVFIHANGNFIPDPL